MHYPSYLIHYNKNHSKSNGQFVSGDGDGDGRVNDRAAKKAQKEKDRAKLKATRRKIIRDQKNAWKKKSKGEKAGVILGATTTALTVAGFGLAVALDHRNEKLNQQIQEENRQRAQAIIDRHRASLAKDIGGDW